MGCATKAHIINEWRQFFVLEEQMAEVDCTMLTPEPVLKASGHVDRFTDYMVRDVLTSECYRADHLVEGSLESLYDNKNTSDEIKMEIKNILPKVILIFIYFL
jgi:glycyl-tRNA synthetase